MPAISFSQSCVQLGARLFLSFALIALVAPSAFGEELPLTDRGLPGYQATPLGQTTLNSVGSDSMGGLMDLWVSEYRNLQPDITIQVISRGSATAAAALLEGTADLGPMARLMKTPELDEFKKKYGFEPTQIKAAIAGIAVYVSKENPLNEITFEQLDAIFSESRKRSGDLSITSWADLGVKGELGKKEIMLVGSAVHSYAHSYFRQRVMLQGDFAPKVSTTIDVGSMLQVIGGSDAAIGFGLLVENGENVKIIAVSKKASDKAYLPTMKNIVAGHYPLGRFLNLYIVREPDGELELTTKDFLRFVLSKEGQKIVVEQGLISLPVDVARAEREKL